MLTRRLLCAFIAVVLAIGVSVGSSAQETRVVFPPDPRPLFPLLQILESANLSGSLEISFCDNGSLPQLPHLDKKTGDSLQALGEMFSSTAVRVTQDSNGIVRMIEPGIPADFLNIRIHHITFAIDPRTDIFRPNFALLIVLAAPEVAAFFRGHDINLLSTTEMVSGSLEAPGPPGSPHISGTLDNVTVREALDRILHSFHGIWVYENCPQSETHRRAIFLRFYRLPKRWRSELPLRPD